MKKSDDLPARPRRDGVRRLVLLVVALAVACSEPATKKKGRSSDPFDDPFFSDGRGASMFDDDFFDEPAPRVGPLSDRPDDEVRGQFSGASPERRALERSGYLLDGTGTASSGGHSSGVNGESDEESEDGEKGQGAGHEKPFSEKAEEATMATMSILMGLGMAALPYLIGAL